ncbi:solute carrier family 35 member F1-like isoform X1 [Zingiber officinale]|uniref:solute carrier family 35 member F1-like isoform X1 n=2 Tax=Zingiber officinale TaxID=94328 RepID=UPI001C4BF65A|nr:solute carrier family 35 member F1-like isoform X1 [Zingiber officinale]XP_042381386.1 solute carrier family 35 member F1-like isoform X1 [Zingiber officinale]
MERKEAWRLALVLFLGQLVSFFIAIASFTSSLIAELGTDTPLTQSWFTYLSLSLVYGAVFLFRGQRLMVPWYWYLALAIVDVQGNYLIVKAYQYTSITSVTLLDCWTIPWVIILTWIALGTRYSPWQFVGAAVCVLGLGLVLLSDVGVSGGGGSKPIIGDTLVIAGTVCYAFSNVGEEFCVKRKDRVELLAMLGIFGVLVGTCEIAVLERKDLESVKWSATMICLFGGFAAATFLFYTVVPFVMKMSGATLFNLSLLTSDMWAVAIRVFFYHDQVDWLYYLAFGLVAIGLIIYSVKENNTANGGDPEALQYERIPQESSAVNGQHETCSDTNTERA